MRRVVLFHHPRENETDRVVVERRGPRCRIAFGERVEEFDAARLPDGRLSLLFDDGRHLHGRGVMRGSDSVEVVRGGRDVSVPISRTRRSRSTLLVTETAGVVDVEALMHGRIVEVRVAVGDRVEQGALLLVLEAMKMQNEIRASVSGTIERLSVSARQTVEGGEFMLSIRSDNN